MSDKLDIDLFEQVYSKLENSENQLALRLTKAIEEAYQASGMQGIEELFLKIREKYVGNLNES